MASPNLMAAALARRTPNDAAILVLGNTLALYSPALRVAEEFAMLDCMTDGRLAAGFPVGTSMDVNRCYGVTPTETRPRFYEAHDLIMKAWTQPGPFPYNGRFNKLRYVNPWPQPLQKPHPPVWLAGGGSVETYEMAVNNDYTYNFLSFLGYRYAKKVMDTFWETNDRLGGDRNPYKAGFAQQICVAETDEQAEELYTEHVSYFFKKCLHVPPYYMETPGYRTKRSTEFILKSNTPAEMAAVAAARNDWKTIVDEGFVIAGSPETVVERLHEACRGLRVGNLIALLQIGSMPHELTKRNITLYAQEVMPKVSGMWADEGWEHRWWPQGARQDARPPARRWEASEVAQPDESFIELRDGRFKIRVLQAGSGDPLLYVHGAGGLFWDPLLDALSANHHVIAPEHPGAGDSQGLEHVEDLWDLVLYYNELLDSFGVDRATVVGHSFGGMIAAEIASTSPHRVDKLVLIAPIGLWRDDHPVPDISGIPPASLPKLVFADPESPLVAALPTPDPTDPDSLFRASQTMASILQFIWPLPDKGLSKRIYRLARRRCSCGAPRTDSSTRPTARTSGI